VVIAVLVREYDLELQTAKLKMNYWQVPSPKRPTWVGYQRR